MAFIYFSLAETKDLLNIKQSNANEDGILEQLGTKADEWITSAMTPFAASLPLTGNNLTQARSAANQYVASLFQGGRKHNFDGAKFWKDMAMDTLSVLEKKLIAGNTGPTKRVAVTKPYATTPLSGE